MGGVTGIVLAAGLSERLGGDTPKQLLRFGERTMVALVTATAAASSLSRVVVVTGHRAGEVRASVDTPGVLLAHNPDYVTGNLSSLRAGVAAAGDCEAVLLLLADMPGVDSTIVDAFVHLWEEEHPWAAVAEYADALPNHPFLLSRQALEHIASLEGGKPLWPLLVENPPHPVHHVTFDIPSPVDVDTPVDYLEALRRHS